jgi:hypothetical protein
MQRAPYNVKLLIRWNSDIQDLDRGILNHLFQRLVDSRYASQVGDLPRDLGRSGGYADYIETRCGVSGQLYVPHNEPGAHCADAEVATERFRNGIIQV